MIRVVKALALLVFVLGPACVCAHHSYSQWSPELVTVSGTVKEFQWTNPHIWIQVMVPGKDGQLSEWGFESAAPGMLRRNGWKADSVKAGDKLTITYHPKKDGSRLGSLVKVVLPDNSVLQVRDLVNAHFPDSPGGLTGEGGPADAPRPPLPPK